MQKFQAKKIVREYIKALKNNNYPFSAIYLFGSFAHGRPHRDSDIDVAVVSEMVAKNRMRGRMKLWKLRRAVDLRIEPHGFSPKEFEQNWIPMVYEIKKTGIRIK